MLQLGTTHTFMVDQLVKYLGLRFNSIHTSMKAMISKAQKITGMSYDVLIVLDRWKGKQDMLVLNLYNYDIILGLDFLRKAKITLMLYLNRVMISSEGCLFFVLYYNVTMMNAIKGGKILIFAIAIVKALQKGGEVLFMVAVDEKTNCYDEVSNEIANVL
jgi:hypothetical protein